ncbi:transmembrane protein 141 [Phlebotomus argentipes]|uniref:transmembrane protein 141 n=1 Tax=Phlebotomus argentipes TaxID=94469 RepID=UPI00289379B7|nr:transmembrane protein 141 [Phlebotomus argentipes]
MNDIKTLKNQQRDKHPGFDSYLECMTRSLFTGLAAFAFGFSGTYFLQKLLQKHLPYKPKIFILTSSIVGSGVAYKATKDRTRACQAAWLAFEDKHTALKSSEGFADD